MKRSKLLSLFAAALLWLGGQNAQAEYVKLTALSGTGGTGGEGYPSLVDAKETTKMGHSYDQTTTEKPAWIVVKAEKAVVPQNYFLVTGGDTGSFPDRNWKTWNIYGGNFESDGDAVRNGEGWTLIDKQEGATLPEANTASAEFTFNSADGTTAYQYFWIEILESVNGGDTWLQMSEWGLGTYDDFQKFLNQETGTDEPIVYNIISGDRNDGSGEGLDKLFDGNIYTKWGNGLTAKNFGETTNGAYFIVKTSRAIAPTYYKLVTGTDNASWNHRNWNTWQIYAIASSDVPADGKPLRDSDKWVMLDRKDNVSEDVLPDKNSYTVMFELSEENTTEYQYFKVEIDRIMSGGGYMQMSEFSLGDQYTLVLDRNQVVENADYDPDLFAEKVLLDEMAGLVESVSSCENAIKLGEYSKSIDELKAKIATSVNNYKELITVRNQALNLLSEENLNDAATAYATVWVSETDLVAPSEDYPVGNFGYIKANRQITGEQAFAEADRINEYLIANTKSFGDPILVTYAALSGSGGFNNEDHTKLIDGNRNNTKWCTNGVNPGNPAWMVFKTSEPIKPTYYGLVTGSDTNSYPGRNWKSWKIWAADFDSDEDATRESDKWVLIDEKANVGTDVLLTENRFESYINLSIGCTKSYQYFRIEVSEAVSGDLIQMNEFTFYNMGNISTYREELAGEFAEFAAALPDLVVEAELEADKETFTTLYEELQNKPISGSLNTIYKDLKTLYNELKALHAKLQESANFLANVTYRALDGNTAWGEGENHTKLVDGDINTKWGGGMPEDGTGSFVIFKTNDPQTSNQYMLVTGNDTKNSPGRNWKTWKIYGATIKGNDDNMATRDFSNWKLIDQKTDIGQDRLPADNFAPAFFNFSENSTSKYKYFKIEVESAYDGGSIQMSEFKMLTDEEFAAYRQEYTDSLTKVATALTGLAAGLDIPAAIKEQLIEQVTATVKTKIEAVATATADQLLPSFADALNYINVEVPALAAETVAYYALTQDEEGVYQIGTAGQLYSFAALVNGGSNEADAVLTQDIDLSQVIIGGAWTSIGTNNVPYKGTFDGQGYTIKNITYTATGQYNGLFGKLSTGATVKNFTAEGTMTISTGITGRACALIAAAGDGGVLIQNINSKMNYLNQLAGSQVGGVLGGALNGNTTVVDRCTYSGKLDGNDAANSGNYGGIVGYANNNAACYLTISNCLFDGELINSAETPGNCTFGGMIGYSNGANVTIKNVLSIGTVQSTIAAQFFGAVKSTRSTIHNSFYKGEVVNGSASTVTLNPCEATLVSDEQLASGEIAAKLGVAFRQNIGTNAYPVLDTNQPVVVEITEAGYATLFVEDSNLMVPEGAEAFAGVLDGSYVTLNAIESGAIAAGEPVVLKGAAGIYSFAPCSDAVKAEANDLQGAAEDIEAAGKYILAKPEGQPAGFYLAGSGSIKAGKAYLEAGVDVKAFFFAGEDATGISEIAKEEATENGAIYNLAGQRIGKVQKGINIIGGKKVLK